MVTKLHLTREFGFFMVKKTKTKNNNNKNGRHSTKQEFIGESNYCFLIKTESIDVLTTIYKSPSLLLPVMKHYIYIYIYIMTHQILYTGHGVLYIFAPSLD